MVCGAIAVIPKSRRELRDRKLITIADATKRVYEKKNLPATVREEYTDICGAEQFSGCFSFLDPYADTDAPRKYRCCWGRGRRRAERLDAKLKRTFQEVELGTYTSSSFIPDKETLQPSSQPKQFVLKQQDTFGFIDGKEQSPHRRRSQSRGTSETRRTRDAVNLGTSKKNDQMTWTGSSDSEPRIKTETNPRISRNVKPARMVSDLLGNPRSHANFDAGQCELDEGATPCVAPEADKIVFALDSAARASIPPAQTRTAVPDVGATDKIVFDAESTGISSSPIGVGMDRTRSAVPDVGATDKIVFDAESTGISSSPIGVGMDRTRSAVPDVGATDTIVFDAESTGILSNPADPRSLEVERSYSTGEDPVFRSPTADHAAQSAMLSPAVLSVDGTTVPVVDEHISAKRMLKETSLSAAHASSLRNPLTKNATLVADSFDSVMSIEASYDMVPVLSPFPGSSIPISTKTSQTQTKSTRDVRSEKARSVGSFMETSTTSGTEASKSLPNETVIARSRARGRSKRSTISVFTSSRVAMQSPFSPLDKIRVQIRRYLSLRATEMKRNGLWFLLVEPWITALRSGQRLLPTLISPLCYLSALYLSLTLAGPTNVQWFRGLLWTATLLYTVLHPLFALVFFLRIATEDDVNVHVWRKYLFYTPLRTAHTLLVFVTSPYSSLSFKGLVTPPYAPVGEDPPVGLDWYDSILFLALTGLVLMDVPVLILCVVALALREPSVTWELPLIVAIVSAAYNLSQHDYIRGLVISTWYGIKQLKNATDNNTPSAEGGVVNTNFLIPANVWGDKINELRELIGGVRPEILDSDVIAAGADRKTASAVTDLVKKLNETRSGADEEHATSRVYDLGKSVVITQSSVFQLRPDVSSSSPRPPSVVVRRRKTFGSRRSSIQGGAAEVEMVDTLNNSLRVANPAHRGRNIPAMQSDQTPSAQEQPVLFELRHQDL
jgi:hypothetical protein